jgi:CubicO group peptidase (beta-lactamase class C family)
MVLHLLSTDCFNQRVLIAYVARHMSTITRCSPSKRVAMPNFPLAAADLASHKLRPGQIGKLTSLIEKHIAEGRYPGCQIALARHGKLLLNQSFGQARTAPEVKLANDQTLWLLYSNTKVVLATALWKLAEEGAFRFTDRISAHIPEFATHGKKDLTVLQVITHQGGFPSAEMSQEGWKQLASQRGGVHSAMRASVCSFTLEWSPGSKISYHGQSAHWVLATLIEVVTGMDYRDYVRDAILEPLGLAKDIFIGVPSSEDARISDMHEPKATSGSQPLTDSNTEVWRRAGSPGGGGYGTARGMVALYQMMLGGGELNSVRVLSPRMLAYAIRNHTGDRVDEFMGMPMHRGLGPHLRGTTVTIRGLGALAAPEAFGHGGVGSSYCWGDPTSGVSFAYITNSRVPDPWHSERLDTVSNLVHAAILS